MRFDDRVAVVTGAGRGLGRAHARLLAERGAAVVVNDVGSTVDGRGAERSPAQDVVDEITAAGGRAVASTASVTTEPEAIVAAAVEAFGRLDIVVNNAGIERPQEFGDTTMADFRDHFDVHLFGTVGVTRAAWPHLVASGAGRVVNTTSATVFGLANRTHYGAAKAAILGFTRSLAVDGERYGVKANCVAPGAGTRMSDANEIPEATKAFLREHMPPELVAPVVVYLAHVDCALTGETLMAAGGKVNRMVLAQNDGITDTALLPETVAEQLATILDGGPLQVVDRVQLPKGN